MVLAAVLTPCRQTSGCQRRRQGEIWGSRPGKLQTPCLPQVTGMPPTKMTQLCSTFQSTVTCMLMENMISPRNENK